MYALNILFTRSNAVIPAHDTTRVHHICRILVLQYPRLTPHGLDANSTRTDYPEVTTRWLRSPTGKSYPTLPSLPQT